MLNVLCHPLEYDLYKQSFRQISLYDTFEFYQIYLGKITIDVGGDNCVKPDTN